VRAGRYQLRAEGEIEGEGEGEIEGEIEGGGEIEGEGVPGPGPRLFTGLAGLWADAMASEGGAGQGQRRAASFARPVAATAFSRATKRGSERRGSSARSTDR